MDDPVSKDIRQRIDREKTLLSAANSMRQSTNNPLVLQGIDTKIRDGRRNIEYLESRLREHQNNQMQKMNQQMDNMTVNSGGSGGPDTQYSQLSGGNQVMPPSAPFAKGPPGQKVPSTNRPNYSKLGKYSFRDC